MGLAIKKAAGASGLSINMGARSAAFQGSENFRKILKWWLMLAFPCHTGREVFALNAGHERKGAVTSEKVERVRRRLASER